MKISFAQENMIKYWNAIRDSEKKTITGSDGKSLVDGVETETFTFTKDYYFMLGDNRHNSADSRYFGYVPEEKIIGKAVLVLFNYHEGKFRWDRFMKRIRLYLLKHCLSNVDFEKKAQQKLYQIPYSGKKLIELFCKRNTYKENDKIL